MVKYREFSDNDLTKMSKEENVPESAKICGRRKPYYLSNQGVVKNPIKKKPIIRKEDLS
jgi:hypothetical protein